tara:strand:- start:156 stop:347 length:192 start_codon:yes stop_codon:yes gene_type:complete
MKRKADVKKAYKECVISTQEMELWDGEPDLYICQGWQEALLWVLGPRDKETYRPYDKKETNNG